MLPNVCSYRTDRTDVVQAPMWSRGTCPQAEVQGPPRSVRTSTFWTVRKLRRMALGNTYYHVGIVVPEVEAARTHLTELLGIRWGPVQERGSIETFYGADGEILNPLRLCYSIDAPHIELIQHTPGSMWECNEHSNLHHVGFWSDTIPEDSRAMEQVGCPLGVCFRDEQNRPAFFAHHRSTLGFWVEMVDAALEPQVRETMLQPDA